MFVEGIGKRGLTKQTAMAPPELMANTNTTWGSLTASTIRKKKARKAQAQRSTGTVETSRNSLANSPLVSRSQVFGGYSNKPAREDQSTSGFKIYEGWG